MPPAEGEHSQQAAEPCPAGATSRLSRPRSTSAAPINDSPDPRIASERRSFYLLGMTGISGTFPVAVIFGIVGKVCPNTSGRAANISQNTYIQHASRNKSHQWQNRPVVVRQTLPVGVSFPECHTASATVRGAAFCEDSGLCAR
jgi:hypothetical protein